MAACRQFFRGVANTARLMGRITVFGIETCPHCKRAKELLARKGAPFNEISLTKTPEWKNLMYILTNGKMSVPEIFFNDRLIGGADELQALEEGGKLDQQLKECLDGPSVDFPPPLRRPESAEFLQVIPNELRQKWQKDLEALNAKLGGTVERPISSLLIMLETPDEMVVVCTAGPGAAIYTVGGAGMKGKEGSDEKLYCQVAIEQKQSLFIDDPLSIPGLEKNEDWVKFGYGYYVGAPWVVGQMKGTVVAMEKQPGILKREHLATVECLRDSLEKEFSDWRSSMKQ